MEKNSIILDTNFRSSKSICKFISKLSDLDDINSGNSIEDISPTIIGYSNNLEDIIDTFLNDCDKMGFLGLKILLQFFLEEIMIYLN